MSNNKDYLDHILALDLGYGWTKAKYNNKVWKEPSVLGSVRRLYRENLQKDDIRFAGPNGLSYFVGNLAIRHSDVRFTTFDKSKSESWTSEILAKCAMGALAQRDEIYAITGLPLDFYFSQKKSMGEFLRKFSNTEEYTLTTGYDSNLKVKPCITKYKIVPQPLGSAMNYLLDEVGQFKDQKEAKELYVILDPGFYTLNVLVLDGLEIHKASHSDTDISISNTYKLVQEQLRDNLGKTPDVFQLDRYMLNGKYEDYDLTNATSTVALTLAGQCNMVLTSLNLNYHKLIITGGWASKIAPLIQPKDNDRKIIMGQDGNVDGYTKIALRECLVA